MLKKIISFTNQANFPKVSMGWSFITRDGGLDQGQGRQFCWGVIFRLGSITWGVILINVMKVVQSSNEHDMKLNVTAKNSKHPL